MCRNIRLLFNFEPPATEDEMHASALQYVRKVSGMLVPNKTNEKAFNQAVEELTELTRRLVRNELRATTPVRDRETERVRAKERGIKREAQMRKKLAVES